MLAIQSPPCPGFEEIFPCLQRLEAALGVSPTLIGAGARNVWLEIGGKKQPNRMTRDIDFAVLATDLQNFEKITNYLVNNEGFGRNPLQPYSLFSPQQIQLDFLPYGAIEVHGEVTLAGMKSPLQVHGLEDACNGAQDILYKGGGIVRVIPPEGIMLLKLIAFNDRPTHRGNDIDDLSMLLISAFDLFLEDIQQNHWDILDRYEPNDTYSFVVGAHYLGRKMRQLSHSNEVLVTRLTSIISEHLAQGLKGELSRALIQVHELDEPSSLSTLQSFSSGFQDLPDEHLERA
jgi:predicted nucleotidyltransferase